MDRKNFDILIDGEKNTLSKVNVDAPWFQFNTIRNKEGHTFKTDISLLKKGTKFETNGCKYEIL